ncbi:MAG: calcium/sodium antiporter [Balneolaceae bacterium]|nr:calcium/sodium antiporter [Balneolaceae bacterium]MBO6546780.1 calcium/sodium antiporter [Balneolaceae bacterium]MBO6649140.1 calcium/sodium antiporter [Balneolaceae bacterium]
MIVTIALFIAGLVALIAGAELFLKAVDHFGLKWGISPLIMGLTVVAFATGAPELAISIKAAASGSADLVLGNIIGSNVANILLILGITSLIAPINITRRIIKIDVPIVIVVSIVLMILAFDGKLTTIDGVILLGGFIAYSIYTYIHIQKSKEDETEQIFEYEKSEDELAKGSWFYIKNGGMLLIGLVMIVLGSNWMVESAVVIATVLGLSELVIGLTIVSIGTSLPEVATSLSAARKGNADIAVANVLGSNLYNVLLTLGLTLIIAPNVLDVSAKAINLDLPFMVAVSIACIPIFIAGFNLTRMDGSIFLFYYSSYLTYLVLDAVSSSIVPTIELAMLWVIVPATVLYMIWRIYIYRKQIIRSIT